MCQNPCTVDSVFKWILVGACSTKLQVVYQCMDGSRIGQWDNRHAHRITEQDHGRVGIGRHLTDPLVSIPHSYLLVIEVTPI